MRIEVLFLAYFVRCAHRRRGHTFDTSVLNHDTFYTMLHPVIKYELTFTPKSDNKVSIYYGDISN